eukprot:TRINITY_DN75407_c0_g1_i1.p1 TRINITY_DN75407_c0_g1~~TRINITY_DN75407_c0_g1_i1.p1  ORF type:complete len:349 (-),score=58.86 TRINITY_DN75407_c0_g1_i1:71-1030(-)
MAAFAALLIICSLPGYFVALVGPQIIVRLSEEKRDLATLMMNRLVTTIVVLGWRTVLMLCGWILVKPEGLDNLRNCFDAGDRPRILIANHTSFFDMILISSFIPLAFVSKVKFMVSKQLVEIPCVGTLVSGCGHISVPFKVSEKDLTSVDFDNESMAERWKVVEEHVHTGGIACWFPEGSINPGDPEKVLTFHTGGFSVPVNVDCEVWCLAIVGNSRSWPKEAAVGGLPARIGVSVFKLCDSSHKLFAEAGLPEAQSDDEQRKSMLLANRSHDGIQAKVKALVTEGFQGRPHSLAVVNDKANSVPASSEQPRTEAKKDS